MPSSPGNERHPEAESPLTKPGRPDDDGDALRADLDEARSELAEMEDRYLRARADLENYRKRSDQELELRVRAESDALLRAARAREGGT
jgi:molecular chaperone GrpE (heat shock protein)